MRYKPPPSLPPRGHVWLPQQTISGFSPKTPSLPQVSLSFKTCSEQILLTSALCSLPTNPGHTPAGPFMTMLAMTVCTTSLSSLGGLGLWLVCPCNPRSLCLEAIAYLGRKTHTHVHRRISALIEVNIYNENAGLSVPDICLAL